MSENNNYNHPSEENPEKFSNIEVSKPETYAAGTKAVLVSAQHILESMDAIRGFTALNQLKFNDTLAPEVDPCPEDVVCFRNFTSEEFPLDKLFSHLLKAKEKKGKVRIAWYGDSFSDGDILVSDLRDTLQSLYLGFFHIQAVLHFFV